MAKIEKAIHRLLGPAIMMPLLKHRFILEFENKMLTEEAKDAMSMSAINFKMDFNAKTIAFEIQQPAALTELACVIADFVASSFSAIRVNAMDGADNILGILEFKDLETLKHHFDLDYTQVGVATHKIEMKYGRMIGTNGAAG